MATASVDPSHKRLHLSGIPIDQNNVEILNGHFKKFGTIAKIIIAHGGDPAVALVTFANHKEAHAAMNSQQPVLGNPDIEVRWAVRKAKSPSTPPKPPFQCQKCTKFLSTKQTLRNHMRQLHSEFDCPVCRQIFGSANEFRKHYNAQHSDSKDFMNHTSNSKNDVRGNGHENYLHLSETVTSLRGKYDSLKKKLKKHKKDKLKAVHHLQVQLVKLLEGQRKTI